MMRMKLLLAAALTFAMAGCLTVPVTQTAHNDDACLQRSVMSTSKIKYAGPPAGPPDAAPPSVCGPIGTWPTDKSVNRLNDANR
jgi:hypothetical protein